MLLFWCGTTALVGSDEDNTIGCVPQFEFLISSINDRNGQIIRNGCQDACLGHMISAGLALTRRTAQTQRCNERYRDSTIILTNGNRDHRHSWCCRRTCRLVHLTCKCEPPAAGSGRIRCILCCLPAPAVPELPPLGRPTRARRRAKSHSTGSTSGQWGRRRRRALLDLSSRDKQLADQHTRRSRLAHAPVSHELGRTRAHGYLCQH